MKIAQTETACESFRQIQASGDDVKQREAVLSHIKSHGGDWTIAEIAAALDWEKSTASRAINELLHETKPRIVVYPERKGRTYPYRLSRPVGLAQVGQLGLWQ